MLSSSKNLALNTTILYGKLIVTIIINFLVSRIALEALGVDDYGLYNIVGGIVALLNTLGTTMIATSYRFIAVEIGKGDTGDVNKVYNTILVFHIFLALFLLLVGESLGVMFISRFLNVDANCIPDALFVLHLSLVTSSIAVLTIPINGLIIARERFLFISIIEVFGALVKFSLVLLLLFMEGNKLRYYAVFLAIFQLIGPIAYQLYCRVNDSDVIKWSFNRNKSDYLEIMNFALGILLGALACMVRVQGAAIIINLFFGTALNAAFGLATQVWTATDQFTNSLRQAAIPQIMKTHSSGEYERSLDIVYLISRYSFLLMLLPAVPLIVGVDGILKLWLGIAPEYTGTFIVLLMISGIIASLGAGFDASIQSTGKIWKNQLGFSIINILLLPIMYIMYSIGMPPYSNAIAMIFISICVVIFQMIIMKDIVGLDIKKYYSKNIIPCFITVVLSLIPLLLLRSFFDFNYIETGWTAFISFLWTLLVVVFFGVTNDERETIKIFLLSKFKKI